MMRVLRSAPLVLSAIVTALGGCQRVDHWELIDEFRAEAERGQAWQFGDCGQSTTECSRGEASPADDPLLCLEAAWSACAAAEALLIANNRDQSEVSWSFVFVVPAEGGGCEMAVFDGDFNRGELLERRCRVASIEPDTCAPFQAGECHDFELHRIQVAGEG